MQYLRYVPNSSNQAAGVFDFPMTAVIRYLQQGIDNYGYKEDAELLKEVVTLSKTEREIIAFEAARDMDIRAAKLVAQGAFTVWCPHCKTYFTPSQIQVEHWTHYRDPDDFGGGRIVLCSMGHELLHVQEWRA